MKWGQRCQCSCLPGQLCNSMQAKQLEKTNSLWTCLATSWWSGCHPFPSSDMNWTVPKIFVDKYIKIWFIIVAHDLWKIDHTESLKMHWCLLSGVLAEVAMLFVQFHNVTSVSFRHVKIDMKLHSKNRIHPGSSMFKNWQGTQFSLCWSRQLLMLLMCWEGQASSSSYTP